MDADDMKIAVNEIDGLACAICEIAAENGELTGQASNALATVGGLIRKHAEGLKKALDAAPGQKNER